MLNRQEYLKKIIDNVNESKKAHEITMNNFDEILDKSRSEVDRGINHNKGIINKPIKKVKKMESIFIDNRNIVEATKYSRYYSYKVVVSNSTVMEKQNYQLKMDNSFWSKLFKTPSERFSYKTGRVDNMVFIFKYSPKKEKVQVDGKLLHFKPFDIIFSTEGCYDFECRHVKNDVSNKEVLTALYVINHSQVISKLKLLFYDLNLSEKGKTNMVSSVEKRLMSQVDQVTTGEEFFGLTEERILMIFDDYEDGDLGDSLISYLD